MLLNCSRFALTAVLPPRYDVICKQRGSVSGRARFSERRPVTLGILELPAKVMEGLVPGTFVSRRTMSIVVMKPVLLRRGTMTASLAPGDGSTLGSGVVS
jgi:hypothetical protein